jgi:hypothetical protein
VNSGARQRPIPHACVQVRSGGALRGLASRHGFDDGAVRTTTLDAKGSWRLTGAPSRPVKVEVASYDPETWS